MIYDIINNKLVVSVNVRVCLLLLSTYHVNWQNISNCVVTKNCHVYICILQQTTITKL